MIAPADRQPIIVADPGPLIRLAAAGLLDTLRGMNRRIVLVDRVEDAIDGDPSKPFAAEITTWIDGLADAVLRVETVVGIGVQVLREAPVGPAATRCSRLPCVIQANRRCAGSSPAGSPSSLDRRWCFTAVTRTEDSRVG